MKEAMRNICHELRRFADDIPAGAERDQIEADLTCLKVRLMALPARVASHGPFETADEASEVLEREVEVAFRDVAKWIEPR